jgi:hypothetical protein
MLDALRGLHAGLSQALALVERLVATGLLSDGPALPAGGAVERVEPPPGTPPRPPRTARARPARPRFGLRGIAGVHGDCP